MLEFCAKPSSKAEIQERLGIKSERHVRQELIRPLLESGRLAKIIPNKPTSPNQRYVRVERTMQVCDECGCGFVEVSSHYGARPSHQDWEDRVYSLNGRVTVNGTTCEDFGESTGCYGEAMARWVTVCRGSTAGTTSARGSPACRVPSTRTPSTRAAGATRRPTS